ncbi:hypothetical protein B0H16DRAFT_1861064 [Mycena metata]|uniref:Uncharacterized protein n=1 Tax=Mycena metata TaxID=1033252 RepID=A0AAD7IIG7_9AGAR|nr:hypothetical protein B0H16DRAFT_1861064 [Mycena metata]
MVYDCYRGNLYSDDSAKLSELFDKILSDPRGERKMCACLQPQLVEFACKTVADEMETRRGRSTLSGIGVVTPEFIENWSLDEEEDTTPFLTSILIAAAQTERAKAKNKKKKPDKEATGNGTVRINTVGVNCLERRRVYPRLGYDQTSKFELWCTIVNDSVNVRQIEVKKYTVARFRKLDRDPMI